MRPMKQQLTNAEMALDELNRGKRYLSKNISKKLRYAKNYGFFKLIIPELIFNTLKKYDLTFAQAKWVLKNLRVK